MAGAPSLSRGVDPFSTHKQFASASIHRSAVCKPTLFALRVSIAPAFVFVIVGMGRGQFIAIDCYPLLSSRYRASMQTGNWTTVAKKDKKQVLNASHWERNCAT